MPRLTYAMPVVDIDNPTSTNTVLIQGIYNDNFIFGVYEHLRLPFYVVVIDKVRQRVHPINLLPTKDYPQNLPEPILKAGYKSHEELKKTPLAKGMISNYLKDQ